MNNAQLMTKLVEKLSARLVGHTVDSINLSFNTLSLVLDDGTKIQIDQSEAENLADEAE